MVKRDRQTERQTEREVGSNMTEVDEIPELGHVCDGVVRIQVK